MSFRLSISRYSLALAVLVWSGAWACGRAEEPAKHNRAIGVSEPTSAEAITNLNRLNNNREGLRQLEEELSKSLQPFSPHSSLDGMLAPRMAPLPRPQVAPRRTRQQFDRRRDWMLLSPEELMLGNTDNDLLGKTPGAGAEQKKNSWEQLYDSIERRPNGRGGKDGDTLSSLKPVNPFDASDLQDDRDLPDSIKGKADKLKNLLGTSKDRDSFGSGPDHSIISDLFGATKDTGFSREQEQAHKAYLDNFKKMLDGQSAPTTPASSLNPLLALPNSPVQPFNYSGMESMGGSAHRDNTPQSSMVPGGFLNATALPDINASVLNQWNPLYTAPRTELPKPAPSLAVPMMDAPRRRF